MFLTIINNKWPSETCSSFRSYSSVSFKLTTRLTTGAKGTVTVMMQTTPCAVVLSSRRRAVERKDSRATIKHNSSNTMLSAWKITLHFVTIARWAHTAAHMKLLLSKTSMPSANWILLIWLSLLRNMLQINRSTGVLIKRRGQINRLSLWQTESWCCGWS